MRKIVTSQGGSEIRVKSPTNIVASLRVTSSPSNRIKSDGRGVYFNKIDFIIESAIEGNFVSTASSSGSIYGSGLEVREAGNGSVVLEGDASQPVMMVLVMPSNPPQEKNVAIVIEAVSSGNEKVTYGY